MGEEQEKVSWEGLRLLAGALVMGALADAWLRTVPGISVLLWVLALAAMIALLLPGRGRSAGSRWLLGPALFFAGAMAWRDSPTLRTLDLAALVICLGLLAGATTKEQRLARAGLTDYARDVLGAGVQTAFGGLGLIFRDIRWQEVPRGGVVVRGLAAVGVGTAVALPPLLIFGGLLASADPIFRRLVQQTFDLDLGDIFSHLAVTTVCALTVGGFLRGLFRGGTSARGEERPPAVGLGALETAVALGLLDLLFLAFVLVQIRYFFGGARLVQATTGLTYAQYARGGFFELVTVAALVLPLLLSLHWLFRPGGPRGARVFPLLAGVQVGLLFVIMASAFQRMRLYQSAYGQTELRLYVTAFMAWLAVVFVWFALTVLRGRRERFTIGALLSAFAAIALLHILNPDASIVRTNAALAHTGHPFDVGYAASLSADAVPALWDARRALSPAQAQAVTARLSSAWAPPRQSDWRTWNWSRAAARQVITAGRDEGILGTRAN